MNRKKLIDELEDVYLLKLGTWSSEYAAIAVDYMIEKFQPLIDAVDEANEFLNWTSGLYAARKKME